MRIPRQHKRTRVSFKALFLMIGIFAASASLTLAIMRGSDTLTLSAEPRAMIADPQPQADQCKNLLDSSYRAKTTAAQEALKKAWETCVKKACPEKPQKAPAQGEYCANRTNKKTCEMFCMETATNGKITSCCEGGPQEKLTCANMSDGKCVKETTKPKNETPAPPEPKNKTPNDPKSPEGKQPGGEQKGGTPEMPKMPEMPKGGGSPSGGAGGTPPPATSSQTPSCTIYASPVTIQKGGGVTVSWNSFNAQSASLSNVGAVEVNGSRPVSPQVTTSYTLTVQGAPAQTQSSAFSFITDIFGGNKQGGQSASCSATVTVTQPPAPPPPPPPPTPKVCSTSPPQPALSECSGTWQPEHNDTGCLVAWRCNPSGNATSTPSGTISCRPAKADVGSEVTIEFRCTDSSESVGNGFSTGGAIFGTSTVTAKEPALGGTKNSYVLTCKNASGGAHASSCTVDLNKPKIVLTATPKTIDKRGDAKIGWFTTGMQSCVISSPKLKDFTKENKDDTSTSGAVRTPSLRSTTDFVLTCKTEGGGTKQATTTVKVR